MEMREFVTAVEALGGKFLRLSCEGDTYYCRVLLRGVPRIVAGRDPESAMLGLLADLRDSVTAKQSAGQATSQQGGQ